MTLLPALERFVDSLGPDIEAIGPDRRQLLDRLAAFVRERRAAGARAQLTFICTHNSRRSHMSQLWAAVAAARHDIDGVDTFSGGTEATAFNPRAVAAMRRAGFAIEDPGGANPHYRVRFAADAPEEVCFSKVFDDAANPARDFAAVMTCTQADEACPAVPGAAARIAIPWDDPKAADDTPDETARYDERCRQIAAEMMYAMSRVGA